MPFGLAVGGSMLISVIALWRSVRVRPCLLFTRRAHGFIFAFAATVASAHASEPLGLLDAVRLAEAESPDVEAQQAAVTAAEDTIKPAGELPDPKLIVGVDNLPINTGSAFSVTQDFMTMRK
ncbi:MAG: hypothetical protein ACREPT_07830, partial [Rudaea sp.]